jgi:hypothetical protein
MTRATAERHQAAGKPDPASSVAVVGLVGDPPPVVGLDQQGDVAEGVGSVLERHHGRRDRPVDVHGVHPAGAGCLVRGWLPVEERAVIVEGPRGEGSFPYPLDVGRGQERLPEVGRVAGGVPADVGDGVLDKEDKA